MTLKCPITAHLTLSSNVTDSLEVLSPNVALNGSATQITNHVYGHWSPDYASYAIDGNFSTDIHGAGHRCAITLDNMNGAWWQVDLRQLYTIEKVAITTRKQYGTYLIHILRTLQSSFIFKIKDIS